MEPTEITELVTRTCNNLVSIFEVDPTRNRLLTGYEAADLVRQFRDNYAQALRESVTGVPDVTDSGMTVWVNEDRTILARHFGDDQTLEMATRPESGATWGPPITLTKEGS